MGYTIRLDEVHPNSGKLLSHHPPCDGFKNHEFSFAGRHLCIGCTGMAIGAVVSSVLVVEYFTRNWQLSDIVGGVVVIGVLLVALELAQTLLIDIERRILRFLVNIFFAIGVSTILIGEDMLRRSLQIDSYILVLTLLWLYIRIEASQLKHQRICAKCGLDCPNNLT